MAVALRARAIWMAAIVSAASGCASNSDNFVYFPALGRSTMRGDERAFSEVLRASEATPPGERLEELSEISSRYLRINPEAFLRVQRDHVGCFGVDFLGPRFTDDQSAANAEHAARVQLLNSISEPQLLDARKKCLDILAGSK